MQMSTPEELEVSDSPAEVLAPSPAHLEPYDAAFGVSETAFAVVGMSLDVVRHTRRRLRGASAILTGTTSRVAAPMQAVAHSKVMAPFRQRFDKAVAHGEEQWQQWVQMGRAEAMRRQTFRGMCSPAPSMTP